MASLMPHTVFAGRYEVQALLGQGGMGAVYEAVHVKTHRRVALKVLLPVLVSDSEARARFAQEASITADVESDHVVEIYDAGVDRESGCPFIVMELLRGESLGGRLAAGQRMSPSDVVEILRQVGAVLQETHARGIIHRDLKPDNVFLARRDDGSCRVKVLDFGIAKVLEHAGMSRNTVNIGTPLYMAPEQLDGSRIGPATDLFALTHIAFELLTGESYWEHEVRAAPSTMALLRFIERGMPEPPQLRARKLGIAVGDAFDAWFLRGTARDPRARFQDARELVLGFAVAVGLPLGSLEVGRLSLTRMLPLRPSDAAVSLSARTSEELVTEPRRVALRRTGEPVITPVRRPRRASPVLMAMGASVLLAAIAGAGFLMLGPVPHAPGRRADAPATGETAQAIESAQRITTTAEPAVKSASSVPLVGAAPSASLTPRPSAGPRRRPPTVKASARPAAEKICRERPERCPW